MCYHYQVPGTRGASTTMVLYQVLKLTVNRGLTSSINGTVPGTRYQVRGTVI